MKAIIGVYGSVSSHWVGDGFPVKSLFFYDQLGEHISPFLLLDHAGPAQFTPTTKKRGVGVHPHRGFETVTIVYDGEVAHGDSVGNRGVIGAGDVQWMTAGKGVIHSEIPQQQEGVMEGFQLWLNLHSSEKMMAPWYRDFQNADLPKLVTPQGVAVTVIAGESHGVQGAVTRQITQPLYLDLHLPGGARFEQPLPAGHNAFVYVYRGEVTVAGKLVPAQRMAVLANDARSDGVVIEAGADARVLLIAGKPLKEPIVQYGPFVMNSKEEIYQALSDFRDGQLGE